MTSIGDLLARNATFARTDAKDHVPAIPFVPHLQLYVVTCIDPRVDPAQLFGLELGDAIVARNVGGRVTDAVLDDLAWISYLHETLTPDAERVGQGPHCVRTRFAGSHPLGPAPNPRHP